MTNTLLEIDWEEKDGPTVSVPKRQGFGLRLLSRALAQFGGGADILFEPSGIIRKMKINLPVGTTSEPADEGTVSGAERY